MKMLAEGAQYVMPGGDVFRDVPEGQHALVDDGGRLLLLGKRTEIVTELAGLLVGAGLESMTITWAKHPWIDVSGSTVYL